MCEKHKTYAERRKRQLAADRARSGALVLDVAGGAGVQIGDAVSTAELQKQLMERGSKIPEVEGEILDQGVADTDAMLKELEERGVSGPPDGKPGAPPQYVPPGMGGGDGGAKPSSQLFGGPNAQCRFCGRSQSLVDSGAAAAARPKTPGEIARQGGDWRASMAPKQREARQAYRELMKAKNRAPKRQPGESSSSSPNVLQIEGPKQPQDSAPANRAEEPPPQPAPPPGAPPDSGSEAAPPPPQTDKAAQSKSEQQKAAQQAYKERMKAKGYAPTRSRGKKSNAAPAQKLEEKQPTAAEKGDAPAPPKGKEQAWEAGADAKVGGGVMDYFPSSEGKKKADQVVELAGAAGAAEPKPEPTAEEKEAEKEAEKRAKQEEKERKKQDAAAEKARKKQLVQEEKERKKREKEEAKRAKKEGKHALYADPEPEGDGGDGDQKPTGDEDGAP